jgi:hypothetical protein
MVAHNYNSQAVHKDLHLSGNTLACCSKHDGTKTQAPYKGANTKMQA